jgi:Winged helix DNA-binding domain
MPADQLGLRALNRITLGRQLLLDRSGLTPAQAIAHLAGLQAQAPRAPYVGLQARLARFRPEQLENLLTERAVLRAHLMRNTVHLVDAQDFLRFRPLFQPVMGRALTGTLPTRAGGHRQAGVDLAALAMVAADLLAETPLTRAELGQALAPRWPGHDPAALAHAASHLLPLVQVPPRGLWGQAGPAAFMLASAWLNGHAPPAPADPAAVAEELVLRYLAAYGPATVADIQAWSGLTRLREVTGRLSARSPSGPARLRPLGGPDGAALLDLADAPPDPDPGIPAPPRFLPEYDNLLLSYAERARVIPHRRPVPLPPGHGAAGGTLLVDGFWQADWKIAKDRDVLEIRPFTALSAADREAIAAEGERLLAFARPAASTSDVRFVPDGE